MNLLSFSSIQFMALFFAGCSWDLRTGDESFGGALPLNPESWVTWSDYPEGAVRRTDEGAVRVEFSISSEGRIINCRVDKSSGFDILDAVPCKLLPRRARFSTPRDSQGQPVSAAAYMTFYFSPDNCSLSDED